MADSFSHSDFGCIGGRMGLSGFRNRNRGRSGGSL